MEIKETKENLILNGFNINNYDENEQLAPIDDIDDINDDKNDINLEKSTNVSIKKYINENIIKKYFKLPLICSFFYLIIIITILISFIFLIIMLINKPNFYNYDIPWEKNYLNDLKYENYHFNNGLEVMLIQDPNFEMDGGAIVINKGYMSNPFDEGIAYITTLLLNYAFKNKENTALLKKYFGNYTYEVEEDFISFRFDILNGGFKKYLISFGSILNTANFSEFFDAFMDDEDNQNLILYNIIYRYNSSSLSTKDQEKHLLEYLVYNLKTENDEEILPEEGDYTLINYYMKNKREELKNKIMNFIKIITNPRNIKIVLFSRYKFSISSKYMKKAFQYLINQKMKKPTKKKNIGKNDEYLFDSKDFKKSQIIFTFVPNSQQNILKIIYFIDKIEEESYSEFYYKKGYFNYLVDILSETKAGSLYSYLVNNSNICLKAIIPNYEYIFKSIIKFNINIELNCLNNINDIIYITYQYINKIISEDIQIDRFIELKHIYNQTLRYTEKTYNAMDISKNNGKNIFNTKFRQNYYFYSKWIPWEMNKTHGENIEMIKKETKLYFSQLKPQNSVIFLLRTIDQFNNVTCNRSSLFPLNCYYFLYNIKQTSYFQTYYGNFDFDSSEIEKTLDENNKYINISPYIRNKFRSNHSEIFYITNKTEEEAVKVSSNILNNFMFKKNTKVNVPKVFISINLLHPFLRPLIINNSAVNNCYYFQILEMFSAIKRKINEALADAIRAGNTITINYNENYLYINIICYEDVAYIIAKEIKTILFDIEWENTDFIVNNEIYKYETYLNFFNIGVHTRRDIGEYYFYCRLKNGLFNRYEFYKAEFDTEYNRFCFKDIENNVKYHYLNKFIINGLIYGYYNKTEAKNISDIFERNYVDEEISTIEALLKLVNNTIPIDKFINWTNEIKELEKNDKIDINEKYMTKKRNNFGYRFISLSSASEYNDNYMEISLLDNMYSNIQTVAKDYINVRMYVFKDLYLGLFLYEPNDEKANPNNDTFIKSLFDVILKDAEKEYNQTVDHIGDRFYYLQKNLGLVLFKKQYNFEHYATEELKYTIYKYSVMNGDEIIKIYNEKRANKNYKFDDLKKYILQKINNKALDVNTVAEKT